MDVHRVRVVVRGHVQGVNFRNECRKQALMKSVAGWVRNVPDGSVEAVFQGRREDVDAMVRWCKTGPHHASVESVESTPEPPEQGVVGFTVR